MSLVQEASNGDRVTSIVVTLGADPGSNGNLVAFVGSQTFDVSTITGGGVTWTQAVDIGTGNRRINIWYGLNSSGSGTAVTVTMAAKEYINVIIAEFDDDIDTSGTIDDTGTASGGSTTIQSGTANTTVNDTLLVAAGVYNGSYSSGPTGSFTILGPEETATRSDTSGGYRLVSATGSYSTTWAIGATSNYVGGIVAFKIVSGAPATAIRDIIGHGIIPFAR